MGIFNFVLNYGKARLARKVLGRAVGGNAFMFMLAAYVGKKIFRQVTAKRQMRTQRYY